MKDGAEAGAAEPVGILAAVVHALGDEAGCRYERVAFAPVGDKPRTLMAPLAAVRFRGAAG